VSDKPIPPFGFDVHEGRAWTPESRVIVALMRRLDVSVLHLSADELASARGMMIAPIKDNGLVVVLDSAH
jgi:hypothetical protein